MKHNYARRQVELFLDEEESLSLEGYEQVENRIEGDGNNTPTQRKLGLDIGPEKKHWEGLGVRPRKCSLPEINPWKEQSLQWKIGFKKPACFQW